MISLFIFLLISFQTILGLPKESRSLIDDPLVVTNVGSIRGLRADDGNYTMFLGIPYARIDPSNKFGDALPYPPFDGEFEAYSDDATCPQLDGGTIDCLELNVFVPDSASSQNPLPVMLWLHSGQFTYGSNKKSLYNPRFLMKQDIVLVSINYRLGAFGFMCLDIPEVPGNAGLKDQLKAIRWVKDNIDAFYGDADKITLSGMSAGGMSTGLHLMSETEKLFTNVIMMSGVALYTSLMREKDLEAPISIARQLGYITNDTRDALTYISNADERQVVQAARVVGEFRPCVENEFPGVERFLADYPINLEHRKAEGISILQGFTSHENLLTFASPGVNTYASTLFSARLTINFNFEEEKLTELESIVRRFYIGDNEIGETMRGELIDFVSDYLFAYPVIRSIPKYLESGAEKIYQYVFSYDGGRNHIKVAQNVDIPGAAHRDDKGYLFDPLGTPEPTPEDQVIIDRITTMWANFVKYGDPTPEVTELLPFKWEPITQDSPHYYLNIDSEMELGKRIRNRRYSFWDLYFESNAEYEMGYRDTGGDEESPEIEEEDTDSASSVYLSPILVVAVIYNLGLAPRLW